MMNKLPVDKLMKNNLKKIQDWIKIKSLKLHNNLDQTLQISNYLKNNWIKYQKLRFWPLYNPNCFQDFTPLFLWQETLMINKLTKIHCWNKLSLLINNYSMLLKRFLLLVHLMRLKIPKKQPIKQLKIPNDDEISYNLICLRLIINILLFSSIQYKWKKLIRIWLNNKKDNKMTSSAVFYWIIPAMTNNCCPT